MVFPRVFLGTHVKHPKVHFYSGKTIEISGRTEAYADGERISELPIQISISQDSLLVYKA
jgi:diacylglycerol kinase (ATP)